MFEAFMFLYLHLCACIFHLRTLPLPIDSSTKPTSLLRRVVVPSVLTGMFEYMALTNTRQNVETCGILDGKEVSILLTAQGRYTTVASVGILCISAMAHGITGNKTSQIFWNEVQN